MNGLDTSPVPTSSTPAKGTKPLTVCWSSPRLLSLCSGKRDLRVSQGAVQLISSVFLFSFSLYKVNQFFPLTPCCRVISSTKRNGREPGHAGNHLLLSVPWGEAFLLELKNLSKFILAQSSCQLLLLPTPFPPIRRECSWGVPRDAGQCHPRLLMLSGAWHYLRGINCTEFCIMYIDSKGVSHTKS